MSEIHYIDVTEPIIITLPEASKDNFKFEAIKIGHAEIIDMDKFTIKGNSE